jgi:hypothetical protein
MRRRMMAGCLSRLAPCARARNMSLSHIQSRSIETGHKVKHLLGAIDMNATETAAVNQAREQFKPRGMTLEEIKTAVNAGKKVHWSNTGYEVRKDRYGEYYIIFIHNDNSIGLTWKDGVTMNGKPEDFFIG